MAENTATWWSCERCKKTGSFDHPADMGVYEGIERIRDAHRKASPDCDTDLARIRVGPLNRPASKE